MRDLKVNLIYNNFWKEIVENADGSINKEQLKKELSDFHMLMGHLTKIYMAASDGKVSYPQTTPEAVVALYEEALEDRYNEGYEEGFKDGQIESKEQKQ